MVDWFIAIQAILETILIIIFIVQSYQNQNSQIRFIQLVMGPPPPCLADYSLADLDQQAQAYFLFAISFTLAKFLENEIYTEKHVSHDQWISRQNSVNQDLLGQTTKSV